MATYDVTNVVTCANAEEWAAFKQHLARHNFVKDVSTPAGFDTIVLDEDAMVATLRRSETIDVSELS